MIFEGRPGRKAYLADKGELITLTHVGNPAGKQAFLAESATRAPKVYSLSPEVLQKEWDAGRLFVPSHEHSWVFGIPY